MTLNLDPIKARAEAATEGPWEEFTLNSGNGRFSASVGMVSLEDDIALNVLSNCDAEFIAHARMDIPALLAEVERLRHQLSHVEVDRDHYKNQSAEVERLRGVVEEVKAFCSDPCTENCCEACNGQNEAYRQVLTILDALGTE